MFKTVRTRVIPATPIKPFPKIMQNKVDGCIVLFIATGNGVCLQTGNGSAHIGTLNKNWCASNFTDYNEELLIHNT